MNTCDSCRFWKRITEHRYATLPQGVLLGDCESPAWERGYSIVMTELRPTSVVVEDDEGWAFATGPKFGCAHWQSPAERRTEEP